MLQKRRRMLSIEHLEDRLVPSGIVTAVQNPFTGEVAVAGDNANNCIQINRVPSVLGDLIQVQGCPGTHTAVNGMTSGPGASFVLASISNLAISDGNGSNTILLGLVRSPLGVISDGTGFVIPGGNITFDVGAGTDNIQLKNITATVGSILVNGAHDYVLAGRPPAIGNGTDTVNYTNVQAGQSAILPGRGPLRVTQTNVTLGMDAIYGTGGGFGTPFPAFTGTRFQFGSDRIRIINSMVHPPPRLFAIGNLRILDGNANNTFFLDTIDVGPVAVTSGTGNNQFTFSHSTDLQADVILGTEAHFARGNNTITMDSDVVTGQHVLLQELNEEGVSNFLKTGAAGFNPTRDNLVSPGIIRDQRHINDTILSNITFTTAFPVFTPQLGVRIDDGDYYFDVVRGNTLHGSTFSATRVDLPGIMAVNLGEHMQTIQLGQTGPVVGGVPGVTDSNDVDAGQLFVAWENDWQTAVIAADVTGQFLPVLGLPVPLTLAATEFIQAGDSTLDPVATPPSLFTSGQVGTLAIDGNMEVTTGNNLSGLFGGGDALGLPFKISNTVLGHLAPTFATGNLFVHATSSTPAPTIFATFFPPDTVPKLEDGTGGGAGQFIVSPDNTNNGLSVFVDPTIVQGDLRIFMGSGGFNHRESLAMFGVTAGNITVFLASDGTEIPDGDPNRGVYISLNHTLVTDTIFGDTFDFGPGALPGLDLTDTGSGDDFLWLGVTPAVVPGFGFGAGTGAVAGDFLTVADDMFITLSSFSNGNAVEAHNTTCGFGIVDGGFASGSTYTDDGGNVGYFTTNLIG